MQLFCYYASFDQFMDKEFWLPMAVFAFVGLGFISFSDLSQQQKLYDLLPIFFSLIFIPAYLLLIFTPFLSSW